MKKRILVYTGVFLSAFVLFYSFNIGNKAEASFACNQSDAGWNSGDPAMGLLELNVAWGIASVDPLAPSYIVGCIKRQVVGYRQAGQVYLVSMSYMNPSDFTVTSAGQEFYPQVRTIYYVMPDDPCCHVPVSNIAINHKNTTSGNSTITFTSAQPINSGAMDYGTSRLATHYAKVRFNSIPSPGTYSQKYDFDLTATYCANKNCSQGTDSGWNYAIFNISAPPKGWLGITKYGPNGDFLGHLPAPNQYFNLCMNYFGDIPGSCTGTGNQSANLHIDSGKTYTVYNKNNNGFADANGWYIDHVQRAQGGPIVPDAGFNQYRFPVYQDQQAWADVYFEKYAATCGNTSIISVNGSTTQPKAGEKFAMTFGMNNPSGITHWSWPTTKLHVKVPAGVTPVDNLGGFTTGSFDWRPATRDLYVAPPAYGKINSGQSTVSGYPYTYRVFFQYDANVPAPSNLQYTYNMVFPSNSPAWLGYSIYGVTTYIKNCPGTSQVYRQEYYPWLQTKNGDVTSVDGSVNGQVIGKLGDLGIQSDPRPGSRHATSDEDKNTPVPTESDYVIAGALASGNGGGDHNWNFCSNNLYVLGQTEASRKRCRTGGYASEEVLFTDMRDAVSNAYTRNGSGVSPTNSKCAPYNTVALGSANTAPFLPPTDISPSCAGNTHGTVYKTPTGTITLSQHIYLGPIPTVKFTPQKGRATIWVPKTASGSPSKLVIDKDIVNTYTGTYSNPSDLPNLAIFVEGDVEISPDVSQLDAIIIATGKIKTCSSYPNANCQNRLIAHGYWASSNGFQFGRNHFNVSAANTNPTEQIILTGQSVAFPPPGLSRNDGNIDAQLQIDPAEYSPRLN